jgi:hypothetical protein
MLQERYLLLLWTSDSELLQRCSKVASEFTPKALANFSPGFPTLGLNASRPVRTLKEFANCSRVSFETDVPLSQCRNPGVKFANSFGVNYRASVMFLIYRVLVVKSRIPPCASLFF